MANVSVEFFKVGNLDMIRKVVAGAYGEENIRKVRPEDTEEWPVEWSNYQGNMPQDPGGTPLIDVPGMTGRAAMGMRLLNIHNAEMLAEASDLVLQGTLGGLALRKSAQVLMEVKREREAAQAANAQLDGMRGEIAALKARLLVQESGVERRGPGRPRKDEAHAVQE